MKPQASFLIVVLFTLALPLTAQVNGSGTTDFIPIWTDGNTLGNSTIFETQGMVGIGTNSPTATLHVVGANGNGNGQNAPTVVQFIGGNGANSTTGGTGGAGAGVQIISGNGGSAGGAPDTAVNAGGVGGQVSITAGNGGTGGAPRGVGGPGGSIVLTSGGGGGGIDEVYASKGGSGATIAVNGASTVGGSVQITGGGGGWTCNALHCTATKTYRAGGSITLQGGLGRPVGNVLLAPGGGNVGIGEPTVANTFEIVTGGTTLADAWSVRSSRRLKINIQPLAGALEKVEQLQGVSYERKNDGKHEIGVVAEDVDKVVPEIDSRDPSTHEIQGVDYSRLAALLIEAVKSQQAELQLQRMEIKRLKTQIAQLRN